MPQPRTESISSAEGNGGNGCGEPNNIHPSLREAVMVTSIASLKPDPNNARLHPERNIEAIKASLALYGQRTPIVVRAENRTVAKGNGTLEAAKLLGWTEIAASLQSMTDAEFDGYALADNRTGDLAQWDFSIVAKLQKLRADAGHCTIGWSDQELKALRLQSWESDFVTDPNEVPTSPTEPVSSLGDLWTLGDHRLLCGDSASPKDIARLMNGKKAVLLNTDPPYGVNFGTNNYCATAKDWGQIKGDDLVGSDLREWICRIIKGWIPVMEKESAFYFWCAPLSEGHRTYEGIVDAGLHIQSQIVWVKNVFALGQADYQWCHEPAWYCFFKGAKHRWFGGRNKRTTWDVDKIGNANYLSPTQKPVELFKRPMEYHTRLGELCAEPFSGSGTQLIAAEEMHRVCYAMEIDPVYVDVALQRWSDFTGRSPVREDGVTFSELKNAAGV